MGLRGGAKGRFSRGKPWVDRGRRAGGLPADKATEPVEERETDEGDEDDQGDPGGPGSLEGCGRGGAESIVGSFHGAAAGGARAAGLEAAWVAAGVAARAVWESRSSPGHERLLTGRVRPGRYACG